MVVVGGGGGGGGVIVLIGMFNVFLSTTAISWQLNHDNFQFSFHKIGQNRRQHE